MIIKDVAPGKRNQIAIGEKIKTPQEAQLYKVVVEAAELAK
jgi:beta-barrel assembly-enhancing protease